jgi:hypothetical protein
VKRSAPMFDKIPCAGTGAAFVLAKP